MTPLEFNAEERRLLRSSIRRDHSCPEVDRQALLWLLYKLERYEQETRNT